MAAGAPELQAEGGAQRTSQHGRVPSPPFLKRSKAPPSHAAMLLHSCCGNPAPATLQPSSVPEPPHPHPTPTPPSNRPENPNTHLHLLLQLHPALPDKHLALRLHGGVHHPRPLRPQLLDGRAERRPARLQRLCVCVWGGQDAGMWEKLEAQAPGLVGWVRCRWSDTFAGCQPQACLAAARTSRPWEPAQRTAAAPPLLLLPPPPSLAALLHLP